MAAFSLSEISEFALLISAEIAAAFQLSSYTRFERSSAGRGSFSRGSGNSPRKNLLPSEDQLYKELIRTHSLKNLFRSTEELKQAAIDIVESEYKSAAFGISRGLARKAVTTAISKKLGLPEEFIEQIFRAESVIQEVDSIEPTLKAVVEGVRKGNEEVLRVWEKPK